ncbi:MAG: hypothetical protein OHK0046_32140 [Anaerolineae bacterium]
MGTIGKFIKKQRTKIGITQRDLAARLKEHGFQYADSSIAFWETERGLPPLNDPEFVRALSTALEVPTTLLLEAAGFFELGEIILGDDLSPMERKLIAAVRNGQIVEALEAFASLSRGEK